MKCFFLIFVWNDDRNKRFSMDRILYAEKSEIRCMCYCSLCTGAFQMCFNCTPACFKCIHLACRIICRRCFMRPPVIKDFRNMSDLAGLLYTAKDKIMILRSVKFLPEAASFTYNRLSGNKKMTDIVIGAQKIQIKIGLQMRLKMLAQICSHLIFIRINSVQFRIFFQSKRNLIKRIWCKQIIMIQYSGKLTFRHCKCCICVPCNSKILF